MCARVTSAYMEFTFTFGPKPEFKFSFNLFEQYVLFNYTTNQSPEQAFSFLFANFFEYLRVFMSGYL